MIAVGCTLAAGLMNPTRGLAVETLVTSGVTWTRAEYLVWGSVSGA
jgi:hypothetical protein